MGISNLIFPSERDETPNCSPNSSADSFFNLGGEVDSAVFDDIYNFANFMDSGAARPRGHRRHRGAGMRSVSQLGCERMPYGYATGRREFVLLHSPIKAFTLIRIWRSIIWVRDWQTRSVRAWQAEISFVTAPLWGLGNESISCTTAAQAICCKRSEQHSKKQYRLIRSSPHRRPTPP